MSNNWESSKFGDGSATGSGNVTTQVTNHYGPRESEQAQGNIKTEGSVNQLSVDFTGKDLDDAAFPLIAPELKAGSVPLRVWVKVKEAFDLGDGTNPEIQVGTETSEGTNGFVIDDAEAESTGYYDVTDTLTGTWAAPLADDTTIGLAVGVDDSTTIDPDVGRLEFVVEYARVT